MVYILLDRVSNIDKGLTLERARPFILPKRTRASESIPGSLLSAEDMEWAYAPTPIPISLIVKAANRAAVEAAFSDASAWLAKASELRMSSNPDRYYLGSIQDADGEVEMEGQRWGRLQMKFLCNPPCWHRVMTNLAGFRLDMNTRIPEQITSENCTCLGTFTGAGILPQVAYTAQHPAALYFKIDGTFSQLALGGNAGLVINYATPQSMSVYIDCVTGWAYHLLGGVLTSVPYSGDFPLLTTTGQIAVNGDDLNCTVSMMAIERG